MRRFALRCLAATAACGLSAAASAAVAWDESVNGDFADDDQRLNPTFVAMTDGTNTIFGTTGNPGTGIDRDYFRFTVPAGGTLTSIVVRDNTTFSGSSGFVAMQAGPQFTIDTGGNGGTFLGLKHYSVFDVNQDILPSLAPSFPGGLPPGDYSVWVQETGGPTQYGFDFNLRAPVLADVPIPGAALLALAGALLGGGALRARRAAA